MTAAHFNFTYAEANIVNVVLDRFKVSHLHVQSDQHVTFYKVFRFLENKAVMGRWDILGLQCKVVVTKWRGFSEPGCPYGGFLLYEDHYRLWSDASLWLHNFNFPTLMCGSKATTVYNNKSPPNAFIF